MIYFTVRILKDELGAGLCQGWFSMGARFLVNVSRKTWKMAQLLEFLLPPPPPTPYGRHPVWSSQFLAAAWLTLAFVATWEGRVHSLSLSLCLSSKQLNLL